jgi:hypothetical protein
MSHAQVPSVVPVPSLPGKSPKGVVALGDPAIDQKQGRFLKVMDARVKPGHDGGC